MAQSKRSFWFLGVVFAVVLAWYFLWSAITPKGQPPLTRLTTDIPFVNQFNRAGSNVRMILLLSPT